VKLAFGNMRDTRSDVPYTLNTSTRRTYQTPEVQPQLATNTLRYGCNKQKNVAVTGVGELFISWQITRRVVNNTLMFVKLCCVNVYIHKISTHLQASVIYFYILVGE